MVPICILNKSKAQNYNYWNLKKNVNHIMKLCTSDFVFDPNYLRVSFRKPMNLPLFFSSEIHTEVFTITIIFNAIEFLFFLYSCQKYMRLSKTNHWLYEVWVIILWFFSICHLGFLLLVPNRCLIFLYQPDDNFVCPLFYLRWTICMVLHQKPLIHLELDC